jgi:hypothetical protein
MKKTEMLSPLVLASIGFELEPISRFSQYMYYNIKLGNLKISVSSAFLPSLPIIEFVFLGIVNSDYAYPRLKISTVGDLCSCIKRGLESGDYSKEKISELFNKTLYFVKLCLI